MNARGVEVLVKAAMEGKRQIRGDLDDGQGGRCAIGVLFAAHSELECYDIGGAVSGCPECGATIDDKGYEISTEQRLIVHLNDTHGWDYLAIARKLGPDA